MTGSLRLFVSKSAPSAAMAIEEAQDMLRVCDVEFEIIDVDEQLGLAKELGILATPALEFFDGVQSRRVIGDFSDTRRIVRLLRLPLKPSANKRGVQTSTAPAEGAEKPSPSSHHATTGNE